MAHNVAANTILDHHVALLKIRKQDQTMQTPNAVAMITSDIWKSRRCGGGSEWMCPLLSTWQWQTRFESKQTSSSRMCSEIKAHRLRLFTLGFLCFSPPFHEFLTVNLSLALHLSARYVLSRGTGTTQTNNVD